MKIVNKIFLGLIAFSSPFIVCAQTNRVLIPVNFSKVKIDDSFWNVQQSKVANRTLDVCIDYTENKTSRIKNFVTVANGGGKHEGIYYDDSDVYKAIEAVAYSLKNIPNATLEKQMDDWIDKIAAAQMNDGYLNTYYSLTELHNRWTDMERHEAYCAGHLIEAALAYYDATGKDKLLQVAIKFTNHIDSTFRLGNRPWVTGHQEIELALVKLYKHTNNDAYLQLADYFIEQRGRGYGKGKIWDEWKDPEYCQDLVPVKDQTHITGHAVRAMYMYTGVADVAVNKKDTSYVKAMKTVWDDVINHHYYITGGIGAQGDNEGFGKPYALPNESAYCETCASVGMVFWNQRMNSLFAQAKYIDVMERTLYNAAIDGINLEGDRFFYGNPLASQGQHERKEWFGTACCPSNISRLITSLGNYVYSKGPESFYVNLFISSETTQHINKSEVEISQRTNYPWNGCVALSVKSRKKNPFTLYVRIPGWLNEPVPGSLYTYADNSASVYQVRVNGKAYTGNVVDGYLEISRVWGKDDVVELDFEMKVKKVYAHDKLKENNNCLALSYGPIIYAIEDVDNPGASQGLFIPKDTKFEVQFEKDLLGGINTIAFNSPVVEYDQKEQAIHSKIKRIKAIPYYTWNNRGKSPMKVWVPESPKDFKLK